MTTTAEAGSVCAEDARLKIAPRGYANFPLWLGNIRLVWHNRPVLFIMLRNLVDRHLVGLLGQESTQNLNTEKMHTSVPPVGFTPTIPVVEQ
jgi:hypothetical protein